MNVVESHKNYDPRLRVFYYLVAAIVLLLLIGLAKLQLFQSAEYSAREIQQNQRRVLFPGPRGNIFDREDRLMVGNQPRFSAVVYLAELRSDFRREYLTLFRQYREAVENGEIEPNRRAQNLELRARTAVVQRYLDQINQITERERIIDPQHLNRHFHQRLLLPYPLISDLEPEEYARILEQIPLESKIQILTASARHYPHGAAAAHLLGYVASTDELPLSDLPGERLMTFNIHGTTGKAGLERAFNDHLQGTTGGEIWVVDPSGFRYGSPIEQRSPVKGNDLVTSIDLDLQKVAERAIGARTGAVALLDVHSGEVLALASKPDYDLNNLTPSIPRSVFAEIESKGAWLNRAVQGLYPPGSTFKLITAMSALRQGVIDPDSTSYCSGRYQVGQRSFPCHSRAGHGHVNLFDAIRTSCNVYFYEHSLPTGIDAIAAEGRRFGLHQKTGIELPYETGRMVMPDRDYKRERHGQAWFPGDTANVSIGQGYVLVTPLQMAAFTASLARGESTTQPTLFRRPAEESHQRTAPIALPAPYLEALRTGMEAAVENGTARFAQIPGMRVAGKTGTAQVRAQGGTLHLAWFIGYAPAEDPQIAIAVMLEGTELADNYAGGTTAAPVAREIMLKYFEKNPIMDLDYVRW